MGFSFYRADADYCDFLRESDPCVPYTMDKKKARPFVGIVLFMNGYNYYAPLTSPKPKHLTMKNQIDFLKINGGAWGAINFNNMIPIHTNSLSPVDMRILPTDDKAIIDYKNLLSNQLSWCNTTENIAHITSKAQRLYDAITSKTARPQLVERCCNFPVDEAQYIIYCRAHNFSVNNLSIERSDARSLTVSLAPEQSVRKKSVKEIVSEAERRNGRHTADRPQRSKHEPER